MVTLWVIWKHRNNLIFGSIKPRLSDIFDDVRSYSFFWFVNRSRKSRISWYCWLLNPKMA